MACAHDVVCDDPPRQAGDQVRLVRLWILQVQCNVENLGDNGDQNDEPDIDERD